MSVQVKSAKRQTAKIIKGKSKISFKLYLDKLKPFSKQSLLFKESVYRESEATHNTKLAKLILLLFEF